jgi:hypothetical protein
MRQGCEEVDHVWAILLEMCNIDDTFGTHTKDNCDASPWQREANT